jgi:hypothetical protein
MKTFLALSFILGLAGTAKADGRMTEYPRLQGIPVNELCDAGSQFESIELKTVCKGQWKLEETVYDQNVFREWVCTIPTTQEYVKIKKTRNQSSTFPVSVYENQGEMGTVAIGTFDFTVRACR